MAVIFKLVTENSKNGKPYSYISTQYNGAEIGRTMIDSALATTVAILENLGKEGKK